MAKPAGGSGGVGRGERPTTNIPGGAGGAKTGGVGAVGTESARLSRAWRVAGEQLAKGDMTMDDAVALAAGWWVAAAARPTGTSKVEPR